MAVDYDAIAAKIGGMKSPGYNRNYFRKGTYHWRIDKCVAKKTDDGTGKDMIALEGDIVKVLASDENSNLEGETVVHVQTDKFDYLFKDQLALCAAILGRDREELKADPKGLVEALKAIFPTADGPESLAVGQVIRVNCVAGKKKDGSPIDRRYFDPIRSGE